MKSFQVTGINVKLGGFASYCDIHEETCKYCGQETSSVVYSLVFFLKGNLSVHHGLATKVPFNHIILIDYLSGM